MRREEDLISSLNMEPPLSPFQAIFVSVVVLGVGSTFFLLFLVKLLRRKYPDDRLPPGPPKLPVIGNLHQLLLGKNPHESLRDLSTTYGPIMHLQLGHVPVVVISSARAAEQVFRTHDLSLADRPLTFAVKHLMYGGNDIGFAPYGPYWRQMRKLCVQQLLSPGRVKSFSDHRRVEVSNLLSSVASARPPEPVNLSELLAVYSNAVVCRAAFGREFFDGFRDFERYSFHQLLREYEALITAFRVGDFYPSLEWLHSVTGYKRKLVDVAMAFDKFFDKVIHDHHSRRKQENNGGGDHDDDGEVKDLVHVLLDLQKNGGLEIPLTAINVKGVIMDMFVAGTDTSSITLDWAMAELIRHPTAMKRVQEEVRSVVGEGLTVVLEDDIPRMDFIGAVIKEVFRLHPSAPLLLPRESREEINLAGYTIPKATTFYINIWAIGRDPEIWGEDAEVFKPERFVGSTVDFKGQNYELIPFGAGRRSCPGIAFGMATVELALAQLLHSFDWELPAGVKVEEMDMSGSFGVNVARTSQLKLVAKPRFT